MNYAIRALGTEDEPALWAMLMHAAHEKDLAAVRANPDLARYVRGWGRAGDRGAIAEAGGSALGAAWLRLWMAGDRGYGWVADEIPELAIAVLPDSRNRGVGTALLRRVADLAQEDFSAICLSVRAGSPAVRLYARLGFEAIAGSEVVNRTGGGSFTMVRRFY